MWLYVFGALVMCMGIYWSLPLRTKKREKDMHGDPSDDRKLPEEFNDIHWIIGYLDEAIKRRHTPEKIDKIILFLAKEIRDLKEK